jgi:acyl-CoA hydrolase
VTEQGFALNTEIRSAKHRAEDIIQKCAHPHFRPLLREYLKLGGGGDEPRPTNMEVLKGWWDEYDEACRHFPSAAVPVGA